MKEDRVYLLHILDAADQALLYASEGEANFFADRKTREAVVRNLEVIGEATKNLSAGLRSRFPDLRWKRVAGMRDKLIHQYFGVSYERVWEVLTRELPTLRERVRAILAELPERT
jgi:uncharacterized protein with HEPN domain